MLAAPGARPSGHVSAAGTSMGSAGSKFFPSVPNSSPPRAGKEELSLPTDPAGAGPWLEGAERPELGEGSESSRPAPEF